MRKSQSARFEPQMGLTTDIREAIIRFREREFGQFHDTDLNQGLIVVRGIQSVSHGKI